MGEPCSAATTDTLIPQTYGSQMTLELPSMSIKYDTLLLVNFFYTLAVMLFIATLRSPIDHPLATPV